MRGAFRLRLARMLGRGLLRIAPPARADFAKAMAYELAEIEEPNEALRFAVGCLWACSLERLRSLDFLLRMARGSMIGGTALFAVMALLVAVRLHQADSSSGLVLGTIAIAFGSASLLLARFGPRAPAIIASAMLLLSGLHLSGLLIVSRDPSHAALYRALALEGLLLWSVLLLGSATLVWASGSAWLRARAEEKGWA